MRKIVKIGYTALFLILGSLIYLEYNNYKMLHYKIDTNEYVSEIKILEDNINIINNFKFEDNKLMTTINRCNILYKDILSKRYIDISDIYFINQNQSSAICFGIDHGINSSYNIENIDIYNYISLYNTKTIDDLFETVLNNEINTTNEFIEMINKLAGDIDVQD